MFMSPARAARGKGTRGRAAIFTVLTLAVATATGCDFFSISGESRLQLFASHHGAPDDTGAFPDYGVDDAPRTFTTGEGWEVILEKGVAVIVGARILSCDGAAAIELDTPFGPYPEDFRMQDLEVMNIAEGVLDPAEYCTIEVEFGPYTVAALEGVDTPHDVNNPAVLENSTVYLRGRATRGDEIVDFEYRTPETAVATLDISTLQDGGPVLVEKSDTCTINLTIVKTYDTLLADVDFATATSEAIGEALVQTLVDETYAIYGTSQ